MLDRIPSFFHSNISLFVLILIGIISGLFAFYQYRRTIPPISQFLQILLGILRGLAIAGILLLLFAPEITAVWQYSEKSKLALLIDRSASMGLEEGGGSRINRALAVAEKIVNQTTDQVQTVIYAFDTDTLHLNNFEVDTTTFGTNIERSINAIAKSSDNIKDLILLTDGNYTDGNNPIYSEVLNQVRMFTIGFGDTVDSPDLLITDVKTNQIIYQNQPTEIKVYLMARGIDNQKALLRLLHDNKVLQAREVQMGRRGESSLAEFQLTPPKTGLAQYRIELQVLPEEAVVKNNSFTVSMDVLKGKVKVGLLSAKPGYENKFLQFLLSNLNEIDLKTSVLKKNGPYFLSRPERILDSLDVLILDNYPLSGNINPGYENVLKMSISKRIPTLQIVSNFPSGSALKSLQTLFPIRSLKKNRSSVKVQPKPSIEEKSLPLLNIFESEEEANKFWARVPPISYEFIDVQFEQPVKILLEVAGISGLEDKKLPVIAAYQSRNKKGILMLGSGFWRWHFLLTEDHPYNESWKVMVKNMIRWLDSKSTNKNVIISSPRKTYEMGEKIILTTQVYDGAFNPVRDAMIRIKISNPSSSFEIDSDPLYEGNYEGAFVPMTPGKYLVEAQAWRNDVNLGKDRMEILTVPVNQEFRDIKQNVLLLKQLAAKSGGVYVDAENIQNMFARLNIKSEVKRKEETMELWNRWPMLLVIIILLSSEWLIRKRKGLA